MPVKRKMQTLSANAKPFVYTKVRKDDIWTRAFYDLCLELEHEFEELKQKTKVIHVNPLI